MVRTVNLRNTIIIMILNLRFKFILNLIGEYSYTKIKAGVLIIVFKYLKPEFINSIDEILIFEVLFK